MNVTDRNQAEESLWKSEVRYQELVQSANSIILRMDPKGRILFLNKLGLKFFAYSENEILGKSVLGTIVPERDSDGHDLKSMIQDIERHPDLYVNNENENMRSSGERVWIAWTNKAVLNDNGQLLEILCIGNDITRLKKTEKALRESENRFLTFMDHLPGIALMKDEDSCYLYINRYMKNFLGKKDWLGKSTRDMFPEVVAERLIANDRKTLSKGEQELIEKLMDKNGRERIFHALKFPVIREGKPTILGTISIEITRQVKAESALRRARDELKIKVRKRTADLECVNIQLKREAEERKRIEQSLRKSEDRLRQVIQNMPVMMCAYQNKDEIIVWNRECERVTGYTTSEILGNPDIMELLTPDKNYRDRLIASLVKTGGEFRDREWKIIAKDGSVKTVSWYNISKQFPIPGWDDWAIGVDITEKKLFQDRLIRSERLSATGQLAASIAHEINSPLQGIVSLLDYMQEALGKDKALADDIGLLNQAFQSIRKTVKNLLDLNRPGKERKQPVSINRIIRNTLALVKYHLKKKKISLNLNLDSELPDINASPQQLGQVIMNLINNAIEAMSGTLRSKVNSDPPLAVKKEICIRTYQKDTRIITEVTDTGPGFADQDFYRVFDPFYTQKKSMGMGVGLSICHGIIEDHKGTIIAANLENGGACVTIVLPVGDRG